MIATAIMDQCCQATITMPLLLFLEALLIVLGRLHRHLSLSATILNPCAFEKEPFL